MCLSRVIGGIHYPSDIFAWTIIDYFLGLLYFTLYLVLFQSFLLLIIHSYASRDASLLTYSFSRYFRYLVHFDSQYRIFFVFIQMENILARSTIFYLSQNHRTYCHSINNVCHDISALLWAWCLYSLLVATYIHISDWYSDIGKYLEEN